MSVLVLTLVLFGAIVLFLLACAAIAGALIAARALAKRLLGATPPAKQLTTSPQPLDELLLSSIITPHRSAEHRAESIRALLALAPHRIPELVEHVIEARIDLLYLPLIEHDPGSLRPHLSDDAMTSIALTLCATDKLKATLAAIVAHDAPRWDTIGDWCITQLTSHADAPNLHAALTLILRGDELPQLEPVVAALRDHAAPDVLIALRHANPERLDPLIPRAMLLTLKLQEARTHDEAAALLRQLVRERWDPALISASIDKHAGLINTALELAHDATPAQRAALLWHIADSKSHTLSNAMSALRDAQTDAAILATPPISIRAANSMLYCMPKTKPCIHSYIQTTPPTQLAAQLQDLYYLTPELQDMCAARVAQEHEAMAMMATTPNSTSPWRLKLLELAPPPLPTALATDLLQSLIERPQRWPSAADHTAILLHALALPPASPIRLRAFIIIPRYGTRGCVAALQHIIEQGDPDAIDTASARSALDGLFKRIGQGERGGLELVEDTTQGAISPIDAPPIGAITAADHDGPAAK
jgi:hypothetical protein